MDQKKWICSKCKSKNLKYNSLNDKKDYILPNRLKKKNLNNLTKKSDREKPKKLSIYPDEKDYIKPSRLQIFNDAKETTLDDNDVDFKPDNEFNVDIDESENNENLDNGTEGFQNNALINNLEVTDSIDNKIQDNVEDHVQTNIESHIPNNVDDNIANNKIFNPGEEMKNKVFFPNHTKENKPASHYFNKNIEEILPKEINSEIVLGKFKGLFKSILGGLIFIYGICSIIVYFFLLKHTNIHLSPNIFVSPIFGGIIAVLGIFIIIYGLIQYNNYRIYTNKYLKNYAKHATYAVNPPFLKEIFIRRIKWKYYIILITSMVVVLGIIIIPFLYGLNAHTGQEFGFGWWKLGIIPDVSKVIIGSWVIVGLAVIMLMIDILLNEKRRSALSTYTSNNILTAEEKVAIVKETKRRCYIIFAIFCILVFLLVIIPIIVYLIKNRKLKKSK